MSYDVKLRAFNSKNQKQDLDIDDTSGLKLDISAIEAGEIGDIFGISSQQIVLPGSKTNNKFFNNAFDLGSTPAVNFIKSVDCQILTNGDAIFTGKLILNNVIRDDNFDIQYNCSIVNETVDFKIAAENTTLQSLNWSKYRHAYTAANVTKSWTNNLFNGDIYYPVINYGSNPLNPNLPAVDYGSSALLNPGRYMNNQFTPMQVIQFKPAIKTKAIVDTIFSSSFNGETFKYSSSFFNSDYFNSLYVLATNDDKEGVTFTTGSLGTSAYSASNFTTNFTAAPVKLNFPVEVYDNQGAFNNTTSTYTCPTSGIYKFNVKLNNIRIQGNTVSGQPSYNVGLRLVLGMKINGIAVNSPGTKIYRNVTGKYPPTTVYTIPTSIEGTLEGTVNAGDTVEFTFDAEYLSGYFINTNTVITVFGGATSNTLLVTPPANTLGDTVLVEQTLPADLTVLDFMQGLIDKFNLVIEPMPNQSNTLIIEPYDTWIQNGQIVDWTKKVDRDTKWKISHPIESSPKTILFKDDDDEDYLNDKQLSERGQTYGTYKRVDQSDVIDGEKQVGGLFAATPVTLIKGTNQPVPQLYVLEENNNKSPFKFKPRLLHKPTLISQIGIAPWWIRNDNGISVSFNYIPTLIPTTNWPLQGGFFASTADTDIHFGTYFDDSKNRSYIAGPPRTTSALNGTYQLFWNNYIESIYDINARKLTCNIILSPEDIKNIRLNDQIFIDGHYYRINKISGADLTEIQSIEVELIKLLRRGYPRKGIKRITKRNNNNEIESVDVAISDVFSDGSLRYYNVDTEELITDPEVISLAANFDGYPVFDATASWDNSDESVTNPDIINLGNNYFNSTQQNSVFVGSNNNIESYGNLVTIHGNDNSVDGSQVSIFGNSVSVLDSDQNFIVNALTASRVVTSSNNNVLLNPIYDVGYYPAIASGSNIFTDKTGSVYLGDTIVQGTTEFRQGVNAFGDITLDGVSITTLLSGSADKKYGVFYDTASQTAVATLTPYKMKFSSTSVSNGVIVQGTEQSELTVTASGTYNLQFSAQIFDNGGSGDIIWIWFRKNGIDIPNSTTKMTTKGGNDSVVAAWNFVEPMNAGEYLEIMWATDDTSLYLLYEPAFPFAPAIPSVIATMTQI